MRTTWCSILSPLTFLAAGLAGALSIACSSDGAEPRLGTVASADRIATFDDPSGLVPNASRTLSRNIAPSDVGQTFGVPDDEIPHPDSYWPMVDNGIDARWLNAKEPSPLEKYMAFADPRRLGEAKAWNLRNHGKDVPNVQKWFGLCDGWVAAAMSERPIVHPVSAKLSGGRVVRCLDREPGCTTFNIGDINGLLAEAYVDAQVAFIGQRCMTAPNRIVRDEHGRISRTGNGPGCKGLNPGSLLIVLHERLKVQKKPLAINAQNESTTGEIWNQPAYAYTVNRYETLTEAEAASLVSAGAKSGGARDYAWNADARGWVFVDLSILWVTENGPNVRYVSGMQSTKVMRVTAVIELDQPPSAPGAEIIGGEFVEDKGAGSTRLTVPPYVWFATGPGPETPEAQGHNPYLKVSIVRELAELGSQ